MITSFACKMMSLYGRSVPVSSTARGGGHLQDAGIADRGFAGRGSGPPLPLPFGKPGDLQVQAALKPLPGGHTDRAGLEEPGQLGVLGGDEIAAQLPLGQGSRLGIQVLVQAGTGGPDAGLQAGAEPVDHRVRSGTAVGQLL